MNKQQLAKIERAEYLISYVAEELTIKGEISFNLDNIAQELQEVLTS